MDTLILHTAETEAHARALMAAWRNRTPIHACATGGPAMSVGRHLLVVGLLGAPPGDQGAEQQLLDTLADQELAALLLLAPGRSAPRGFEESLLPMLASTGDAAQDAPMIDNALRELGRTVVFGGAARAVFGLIGRPRAPKLQTAKAGAARPAQDDEPEWAPDPSHVGAVAASKARRRSIGYALGLGLGVLVVMAMLAPWAMAVLLRNSVD